jgi:hypothetical protein
MPVESQVNGAALPADRLLSHPASELGEESGVVSAVDTSWLVGVSLGAVSVALKVSMAASAASAPSLGVAGDEQFRSATAAIGAAANKAGNRRASRRPDRFRTSHVALMSVVLIFR